MSNSAGCWLKRLFPSHVFSPARIDSRSVERLTSARLCSTTMLDGGTAFRIHAPLRVITERGELS